MKSKNSGLQEKTFYASGWIRLMSGIIDLHLYAAVFMIVFGATMSDPIFVLNAWDFVVLGAIIINEVLLPTTSLKGTIGMRIMALHIRSENRQTIGIDTAFIRFIVHGIILIVFSPAIFYMFFNSERKGLHDVVAKTDVTDDLKTNPERYSVKYEVRIVMTVMGLMIPAIILLSVYGFNASILSVFKSNETASPRPQTSMQVQQLALSEQEKHNKELFDFVKSGQSDEFLLFKVLSKGVDINVRDDAGKTPIFYAVEQGNAELTRALRYKGASVDVKDADGHTVFDYVDPVAQSDMHDTLTEKIAIVEVSRPKVTLVENKSTEKMILEEVIVFSRPRCSACKHLKKFLSEGDIPFSDYDVMSYKGQVMMQKLKMNYNVVPVTVIGNYQIVGFDTRGILNALQKYRLAWEE